MDAAYPDLRGLSIEQLQKIDVRLLKRAPVDGDVIEDKPGRTYGPRPDRTTRSRHGYLQSGNYRTGPTEEPTTEQNFDFPGDTTTSEPTRKTIAGETTEEIQFNPNNPKPKTDPVD